MPPWSQIIPLSPIPAIEKARKRATTLRGQEPQRRGVRDAATARVTELEREDRESMATAYTAGKAPTSNIEQIEKARADAAGEARALQALDLAIANSESELHETAMNNRSSWQKAHERELTAARNDAREAMEQLRDRFTRYQDAQQVSAWLAFGLDRDPPHQITLGLLGNLPASARWAANGAPINVAEVLDWFAAALAEPTPEAQTQQPSGAALAVE